MKAFFGLCVLALGFSVTPALCQTSSTEVNPRASRSLTMVPAEEQHLKIVKIVGSVPIPEDMRKANPSQAQLDELRDQAVQQAKKLALDRASQDLAAGSGTPGWSIRQPRPEDVYVIQLTDLPPETDRFSLVMVAEVRFGLEQKPDPGKVPDCCANAKPCEADACLTARVSTDKTVYTVGDQVVIHLTANRDFYGVVYYEDVAGKQIQVLPNAFRSANFFKGGTDYVIPGEGDKFTLRVTTPVGTEKIVLRASTQPLPLEAIPTTPLADGRKIVDVPPQQAASLTRSLMVVGAEPTAQKPDSVNSADEKSAQLNEATREIETKLSE